MFVIEIELKCPHCGKSQTIKIRIEEISKIHSAPPITAFCHPCDGGCDNWFVYRIIVQDINVDMDLQVFKLEQVTE